MLLLPYNRARRWNMLISGLLVGIRNSTISAKSAETVLILPLNACMQGEG